VKPSSAAPAAAAPAAADQPVQGTILGSDFVADQILIDSSTITFRQGKEFFPDRAVSVDVSPATLPDRGEEFHGTSPIRRGKITLAQKRTPRDLPSNTTASDYQLLLTIGPKNDLGAPVEIHLEATGEKATRIAGRGFATFDDIRVAGDQIDLHWDSFDTLRYVAKAYVQNQHSSQQVAFANEFGARIRDPGKDTEAKTGFVGYEVSVAGASPALVKLQLRKDERGWGVANTLLNHQIDDAHPLDTTNMDSRSGSTAAAVVAGLALESKLQREQLISRVRGTLVSCTVDKRSGHGSCSAGYELAEGAGKSCHTQNFRMAYQTGRWAVTGEIGPEEGVDTRTGAVVERKPFSVNLGCQ
jgi:hypothetical protein